MFTSTTNHTHPQVARRWGQQWRGRSLAARRDLPDLQHGQPMGGADLEEGGPQAGEAGHGPQELQEQQHQGEHSVRG